MLLVVTTHHRETRRTRSSTEINRRILCKFFLPPRNETRKGFISQLIALMYPFGQNSKHFFDKKIFLREDSNMFLNKVAG